MKKNLLLGTVAAFAFAGANAQSIVTTDPQFRSVVLEEFTGLHCTYCPDGHVRADAIKAANPGRAVLINIHTGGYAVPSGSEPDMRTSEGDAIANLSQPNGYPAGSVNRDVFPASDINTAMGRSSWASSADQVLMEPTPVNVGATTTYNSSTRELTIDVEAYYTANSAAANNYIHVALIQDSILGPQTGGTTYNPTNYVGGLYVHSKVLRDLVTPLWGDTITSTTQGSLYQKQYVYTLPTSITSLTVVPEHCKIAIFVTETKEHIYTGIELGLDGVTNNGASLTYYGGLTNLNTAVLEGTAPDTSAFTFDFTPSMTTPVDFIFELTTDAPGDWNGYYTVNGTDYTSRDTLTIMNGTVANLGVGVIPGATGAVSKYTLIMKPINDTTNVTYQDVYVISGITDLVVNGTGDWGDGLNYNWESLYTDGLNYAGNTAYDATSGFVFKEAKNANALSGVNNIYLNVGWTFPSFTDDEANAIVAFMNAGGNVFVAGQDIAWDIMSGSGYGTSATINLFSNYFNSTYVADGSASSNSLTANSSDAVFGTVSTSSVIDAYNGNMYPDQVNPKTGGLNIFNYPGSKSAGTRYENGTYKVVYMGVGMEMVQNTTVKNDIIKWSHDWFYGLVSTEEFDNFANSGMKVYPNPNNGNFTISINAEGVYNLSVVNLLGEEVYHAKVNNASATNVNVDLSELPAGVYVVKLANNEHVATQKIIVE
ncbi:MAG: Omp28-related outer membrane protein [Flavobacteriales bacterium]|nr:Omp28-related outer membrane protein [Flavobacteriales bacterium]